mgnify:CR=1 FL=1
MGERLTQGDIDKIKKEIEYRTLVVRKEAIEAVSEARRRAISVRILSIMRQKRIKTKMRAAFAI